MNECAPLKVALVGLGYWGPNLLRAAAELDGIVVATVCDLEPTRLTAARRRDPRVATTTNVQDILDDSSIDGVLIATPIGTHHDLALRCLRAGKHVFVEQPMAQTSEQCLDLIECATAHERILMPGHTFLYSPAVVAIKSMLDHQALGEIYFVTATRVNLGIHQNGSNVIQDLGPHDFSILHYWLGAPLFVRAIGRDSIVRSEWDVCFVDLGYPTGTLVRVELSWLAPSKLRRTVLAGRKGMVVYDDTSSDPIKIHDCGVNGQEFGAPRLSYRTGDIISPRVAGDEPLRLEIADFVRAVRSASPPRSDMHLGMEVVRMVEAAELSLHHSGSAIPLNLPSAEQRTEPDRRRTDHGMPWFDGPTTLAPPPASIDRAHSAPDSTPGEPVAGALPPAAPAS
jgi:predicted dehydrogenase